MEVSISGSLIDSYISHDQLVSVNNVLREYDKMKEEIKKLKYFNNSSNILIYFQKIMFLIV